MPIGNDNTGAESLVSLFDTLILEGDAAPAPKAEEPVAPDRESAEATLDDSLSFDDLGGDENAVAPSADATPVEADFAFDDLDGDVTLAPTAEPPVVAPATAERPVPRPVTKLPRAVLELVELLASELHRIDELLRDTLIVASADHMEATVRTEALVRCGREVELFGMAADAGGFTGLAAVSRHLQSNLAALAQGAECLPAVTATQLESCLQYVLAYLDAPTDSETVDRLVNAVANPAWTVAYDPASAQDLRVQLAGIASLDVDDGTAARVAVATPEDVSLEIPSDVNPDLLDALLQELPGHTEEFSAAIQRLMSGGSLDDINIAQRLAHTLKGAGNTVGVRGVAVLTHHLEDILLALSRENALPAKALATSLMVAADCLEGMTEAILGESSAPDEALDVLQEVLDWANRIDRDGLPEADAAPMARTSTRLEHTQASLDATRTGATPRRAEAADSARAQTAMIRLPAALVDELLRLVGETIILTGQVRERVERANSQTRSMREQFDLLQRLGADLEQFIDLTDLNARRQVRTLADATYDALEMDQYNELHTYSRRLVEAATDASEMGKTLTGNLEDLENMLGDQERLNGETQETVMRTRMVPVKSVFPRLQRAVRQTCRLTEKHAELHLGGGETLMDSEVLQAMIDPLMHLLRNAVDHGIEDAATRQHAGKPSSGNVRLEFGREGNNILIRCSDDGAGLDFEAIREKARSAGLLAEGHTGTEEELKRFVLRPNFSTRETASQTSGRGIGLDAVNVRVAELGGSLALESTSNRGCKVDLRLPVSLISSHALLVQVGPFRLAVANRGVTQILHPASGELRDFGQERVFHLEGQSYAVKNLGVLLGLGGDQRARPRDDCPLLMVEDGSGTTAVLVDKVLETRDLVVKNLGRYIPKLRGLLGATILGDGGVTPVLDLPEILRAPTTLNDLTVTGRLGTTGRGADRRPLALVVDDSLSARRSLAQFLEDAGYEVRTARDGLEAVEILNNIEPVVLLVDLEMPRMNGLELTAHVRTSPKLARVPIVMITSRSAPKHREQAEAAGVSVYLTKPFAEDELLEHLRLTRSA